MLGSRLNLPNSITIARIASCPVIFFLALGPGLGTRATAFALFVVAALSDLWDGYIARRYDMITDLGKLLDPIADKLLLAATFVPFFIISHRGAESDLIPWWGPMPVWVIAVIFGREIFVTLFRSFAVSRGVVIAAGKAGKIKAAVQSVFVGALLLWYPLGTMALRGGWDGGVWAVWRPVHAGLVGGTLWLAIVLTVYSLLDYLWSYRSVLGMRS